MALPDRIKEQDLAVHGFEIVSDVLAKHTRYNSCRHKCTKCGIWAKQLYRDKPLCKQCWIKESKE
ncbi:MAG: hypothetical protein JRJ85_19440 [Deltaproteobacteria bacterium]|nr:hypothetical protein [Deltaproteobacteria bacterium]